jgi:hypothetical protein
MSFKDIIQHLTRRRLIYVTQCRIKDTFYILLIIILLISLKFYNNDRKTERRPHEKKPKITKRENSTNITKEYVTRYKREVPVNFDKWIKFALQSGCSLSLNDYEQINIDLKPFRKPKDPKAKTINNRLLSKEANYIPEMSKIVIKNRHIDLRNLRYEIDFWRAILADVIPILPKRSITMIVNDKFDEPKVLSLNKNIEIDRSSKRRKFSKFKLYTSVQEALSESECLRSKFKHVISHHGFLNEPDSFMASTKLVPLFSPCKLECFNDILFPFHMNKLVENILSEENRTVPDTWTSRSSRVVWRGATTGSDITLSNGFEKFSHRFKLVQWAMNGTRSKKLDIDVGFASISNAHSQETEAYIWKVYKKKNFLSRDDQFKSKYAIMVDGNTWY